MVVAPAIPASGAELGRFRVTRVIGEGGQGVVCEALHTRLGQRVALKFLSPEHASDPSMTARFDREARNASRLRSPYAARVFDVDQTPEGLPFIVAELLEGRSLRDEVLARGPLPVGEAIDYVRQVCAAMAEAHELGIVHRDIKPSNVFLAEEGGARVAKVLDFGVSKGLGLEVDVTQAGTVIGSPRCMSPEQIADPASVDARTDIWSLGVLLFYALAAAYPFDASTAGEAIVKIMTIEPQPLRELRPDAPSELEREIARALRKNPELRHATVRELAHGLAPFGTQRVSVELSTCRYLDVGPSPRRQEPPTQTGRAGPEAPRVVPTNLAAVPTRFFGREADLHRIERLLAEGRRCVTLLGPAGAGKTRLARRFGEMHAGGTSHPGGVWFCDLTEARDLAGVLVAVSHAIDESLSRALTEEQALDRLGQSVAVRGSTILILDNCEQVVDAAARVVTRILETASGATLIVTSREGLRVPGEQVHMVSPLAVEGTDAMESDAVRLFVDRAQGVLPGFAPGPDESAALVEIVRRLDGLPLAIELAAARVATLSVHSIRQRLEERFALLAGGSRFMSERQRTMRGAIDWSWRLLPPWEQAALAQAAIFRGGFALDAAERVLDTSAFEGAPPILDVLQSLCEKSLVVCRDVLELRERRYRLYESVREYALGKLRETGGESRALDRHCEYFAKVGAEWGRAASLGDAIEPRQRLTIELENLLAAHRHALSGSPMRANAAFMLLRGLTELLKHRGPLELCLSLLDATLAEPVASRADQGLVGGALCNRAYAKQFAPGANEAKVADLTRALEIARATGDAKLELGCLGVFASVDLMRGNPDGARAHSQLAVVRARAVGDSRALAKAYADLGSCDLSVGRLEEARSSIEQAIALSRRSGDRLECANYLARAAEVSLQLGLLDHAQKCAEEGMSLCRPFGHRRLIALLFAIIGMIEQERGNLVQARTHFDDALESARQLGGELLEPFYRALRSAVLADSDDVEGASADLDYAEAQIPRFSGDPVLEIAVSVVRGHLDLALGRAAARRGEVQESLAHRARAERRLDALAGLKYAFEDLPPLRRRLERTLASAGSGLALVAREASDRLDALVVAEDGRWFRAPGGKRVELSHRPNLKRVLVSLTAQRIGASGEPLSLEAVFRSGWPGERASPSSAANRARVALARLRKLGLGEMLLTREGYLLNPEVPIVVARVAAS
jgi:predicted ATPase